ncbi:hypothetical protein PV08_06937 [Exophiala spinifera]|uniref:Xylanolytic transcriptional activator regulatory domain-containing protein n=1 Tax=Exophiala spinifera TaxID=91928 RepID=A0A0D1YGP1_9EURO|nr:uncharacterized protein PV08_06937 [Exophiala spinifera]KIW14156.1 hypothetical protein PV08_06937 [Exophiala spinifera]
MFEKDEFVNPLGNASNIQPNVPIEIITPRASENPNTEVQIDLVLPLHDVTFSEETYASMDPTAAVANDVPFSLPLPEQDLTETSSYGLLWDLNTMFPTNSFMWTMDTQYDSPSSSQQGVFDVSAGSSELLWNSTTQGDSEGEMLPPSITTSVGAPIEVNKVNMCQSRSQMPEPGADDISIPILTPEDEHMAASDVFGYIHRFPAPPFEKIMHYYYQQHSLAPNFVSQAVFHTFLELYFEHFAPELDFLHPSILESDQVSWILLLVVAALGSQFSVLEQSTKITLALQELMHRAIKSELPSIPPPDDLTWTQTVLLRDICLFGNGGKKGLALQQYHKYTLATLCRAWGSVPGDSSLPNLSSNTSEPLEEQWHRWLAAESRIRLAHSVYHFESLQYMFLQLRPSMDLSELTNSTPSTTNLWNCRSASDWARQLPSCRETPTRQLQLGLGKEEALAGDAFCRKLQYIFASVEEKLTLERLLKWPLRNTLPFVSGSQARQQQETQPSHGTLGDIGFIHRLVRGCVDSRLHSLYPQSSPESFELELSATPDVIFPLLALLRRVSLTTVHAMSGWQANEEQIQVARATLSSWMKNDAVVARTCLRHAVVIFSALRAKTHFGHYDALSMLAAALYIWAYDQLVENEAKDPQHSQILRLDKPVGQDARTRWMDEARSTYIHIPGIGILDGRTSPLRTLQELRRVLKTRTGWPEIRTSLVTLIGHLLQGRRPRMA